MCICRDGRTRSVAAKTVLDLIFNDLKYETSIDDGHLSRKGWATNDSTMCTDCKNCKPEHADLREVRDKARKMWRYTGAILSCEDIVPQ